MNSLRFAASNLNNGSSSMAYHPDIDDLRGIAVLLLVSGHCFPLKAVIFKGKMGKCSIKMATIFHKVDQYIWAKNSLTKIDTYLKLSRIITSKLLIDDITKE